MTEKSQDELYAMNIQELRAHATEQGVPSAYRYRKHELVDMLLGRMSIPEPIRSPRGRPKGSRNRLRSTPDAAKPAVGQGSYGFEEPGLREEFASGAPSLLGSVAVPPRSISQPSSRFNKVDARLNRSLRDMSARSSSDRNERLSTIDVNSLKSRSRGLVEEPPASEALDRLAETLPSASLESILASPNRRPSPSRSNRRSHGSEEVEDLEIETDSSPSAELPTEARLSEVARERRRAPGRKRRGPVEEEEALTEGQLIPIAGILDVLDSCAFIRTTGYQPGLTDVYVSINQVKKYNLRKGDSVTGQIRQPREGENTRQRHFPLVQVDTVSNLTVEQAGSRQDISQMTPVSPHERLRVVSEEESVDKRMIDLVSPLAKGQRGLIVGPRSSGRSILLSEISQKLLESNPKLHLMSLLIGARPEEVTVHKRSLKGEIVAAGLDSAPEEQISTAELALERAKRLVELGYDVLLTVDSLTQLGRAYALTGAVSNRLVGSSIELAVLRPLNHFFSAARKVENSGSLTMIGTALSGSVSELDRLIEYDLTAAAGMRLVLGEQAAARRQYPAIDPWRSFSRDESELLSRSEQNEVQRIRVRTEAR